MKSWMAAVALSGLFGASAIAQAAPPSAEDAAFARRMAALTKSHGQPIAVRMKIGEDPKKVATPSAPSGIVNVSGQRMGLYTPPLISSQDIQTVVQQHMVDIRTCYKKQLDADPEWADRLILDLAIKKTGRVSEVSVAPRRVKRAPIGQCLMSSVPKWKFPEFTGETDDGITQEVVNASFPFSFSVN